MSAAQGQEAGLKGRFWPWMGRICVCWPELTLDCGCCPIDVARAAVGPVSRLQVW